MSTSKIAKERIQMYENSKNGKKKAMFTILGILLGGVVTSAIIIPIMLTQCSKPVNNFVENDIPNTDKFYSYATDGSVKGWSEEVINDPHILYKYNTMNLHGKTIDGTCRFAALTGTKSDTTGVFKKWAGYKIDLSDTRWKGYALGGAILSGYETFMYADLSRCFDLNLSGAEFAVGGATASTAVTTAANTFYGANLSEVTSLNLSSAVFAEASMTTSGVVSTAGGTFLSANLSGLTSLNLSGAVFAAVGMTTSGFVGTATSTFEKANLSRLASLNLSGALFAVGSMTSSSSIASAKATFFGADFSGLNSLDLSGLELKGATTTQTNIISTNCFNNTINSWSPTNKLQIGDDNNYWKTASSTQIAQLTTWFGDDKWQ